MKRVECDVKKKKTERKAETMNKNELNAQLLELSSFFVGDPKKKKKMRCPDLWLGDLSKFI